MYKLVLNWFVDFWRESREPHAIRSVKKKNSESMILSPLRLVNFDMPGVVLVVVVVVNFVIYFAVYVAFVANAVVKVVDDVVVVFVFLYL